MGKYIHFRSVEIILFFLEKKGCGLSQVEFHPNRKRTKRGTRNLHRLSNDIFQEREVKEGLFMVNKMMREKKGENIFCPTKLLPLWHLDHQTLKY